MNFGDFLNLASNNTFWKPITSPQDKNIFDKLFQEFEATHLSEDKDAKGKALEKITTKLYERFSGVAVKADIRTSDNQLDHTITFQQFGCPPFIKEHVGYRFISESKNHKDSISSREVAQLYELLTTHEMRFGVFTSYKSFSKGLNGCLWKNGEGKRRKLSLASKHKVIGLCYEDLHALVYDEANLLDIFQNKTDKLLLDLTEDEITYENSEVEDLLRMIKKLKAENIFSAEEYKIFSQKIKNINKAHP